MHEPGNEDSAAPGTRPPRPLSRSKPSSPLARVLKADSADANAGVDTQHPDARRADMLEAQLKEDSAAWQKQKAAYETRLKRMADEHEKLLKLYTTLEMQNAELEAQNDLLIRQLSAHSTGTTPQESPISEERKESEQASLLVERTEQLRAAQKEVDRILAENVKLRKERKQLQQDPQKTPRKDAAASMNGTTDHHHSPSLHPVQVARTLHQPNGTAPTTPDKPAGAPDRRPRPASAPKQGGRPPADKNSTGRTPPKYDTRFTTQMRPPTHSASYQQGRAQPPSNLVRRGDLDGLTLEEARKLQALQELQGSQRLTGKR